MNKNELKDLIKTILDEISSVGSNGGTPGGAGPIQTPHAFKSKKKKKSKINRRSLGYPTQTDSYEILEGYSRYKRFKESPIIKSNHSKVSFAISEVKKMLKEVDFLVNIASKLKNEDGIPTERLWKRTSKNLQEIEKYSNQIANKIKNIK